MRTTGFVLSVLCLAFAAAAQEPPSAEPDWDALRALERARRWAAAESLAIEYAERIESAADTDSSSLARALLSQANAAWEQRRHGEPGVVETLARSIALQQRHDAPGSLRLPWTHLLAARVLYDLAQSESALEHARSASRLVASMDHPDTVTWADAELYVGTSAASLARTDEARRGYARSLELREAKYGSENSNLVPVLAEYAMMLTEAGDFDEARSLLVRAERLAQSITSPYNNFLTETLARRSTLEARAGNLAEAIELADRTAGYTKQRWGEESVEYARARVRVAYRLEDFGDYAGEAQVLSDVVPILDSAIGVAHPQTVNARLAWIESSLEIGDTTVVARELPVIRRALEVEPGTVNRNLYYALLLESRLAHARGATDEARALARRALALDVVRDDASGRGPAIAIGALLRTCAAAGDRALVDELATELASIGASTSVQGTKEWIELLAWLARAQARVGDLDAAWTTARGAETEALEWFRYEVQALPDGRALQLASRMGGAIDLLVTLAQDDQGATVTMVWDRLVRWRGLVAQEIARRRPAASSTGDDELAQAHAQWLQAQRRLARQVVAGSLHPTDEDAARALDAAKSEAEARERAYVRAARGEVREAEEVSLASILAGLGERQALVAFARGDDGSGRPTLHAFVARGDGSAPVLLAIGPERAIEAEIGAWREQLVRAPGVGAAITDADAARHAGEIVRRRVWDPVMARIGAVDEILIVPEGPTHELPWLALPIDEDRYLAEGSTTVRVLNAERELRRNASAAFTNGLLAIGGPDFDAHDPEAPVPSAETPAFEVALRSAASPCVRAGDVVLEDLPAARAEAEEVASIWSSTGGSDVALMLGPKASELGLKQRAPGRSVLHLATHGIVIDDGCAQAGADAGSRGVGGVRVLDPAPAVESEPRTKVSPWLGRRVWLALAGANQARRSAADENEGLLTAEEIVTLDLRSARWVVLSACDSGVGEAWAREGLLGLRRAFHLAGAEAVIATQWPIGDESAREWMRALYHARTETASAGEAVQAACRSVLAARRADGRSTAPFHWAAFVATGD